MELEPLSKPPPIEPALRQAQAKLLDLRSGEAVWRGRLSASALSTATALVALALAKRESRLADGRHDPLIEQGLAWLATHANTDGGWGDSIRSRSNLSTTTLVWAAFGISPDAARTHQPVVSAAEKWLRQRIGKLEPDNLARKVLECYQSDGTFSVPIGQSRHQRMNRRHIGGNLIDLLPNFYNGCVSFHPVKMGPIQRISQAIIHVCAKVHHCVAGKPEGTLEQFDITRVNSPTTDQRIRL